MSVRGANIFLFWGLVAVLSSCSGIFGRQDFNSLSKNVEEEIFAQDPIGISNVESVDHSPQSVRNWFTLAKEYQDELNHIERTRLKREDQLQYDLLQYDLNLIVKRDSFLFHDYPITHIHGAHLQYPALFERKHVGSRKEMEGYLENLKEVETKIGSLVDGLEYRRKAGIIPPTFILEQTIHQCDSLASLPVEMNPFYTSFEEKLNAINLLEPDTKSKLLEDCKTITSKSVIPSYKRLTAYLRQLERTSLSVAGVWQLPNGSEYYQYCLLRHSGTENNPNQLYEMGKVQLSAIEGELAILQSLDQFRLESLEAKASQNKAIENGYELFRQQSVMAGSNSVSPKEKAQFLIADQLATAKMMVDIGIHHKQWLREQAVRFFQDHTRLSEPKTQQLVDEIVVRPGYAAAEKIIFIRLKELQGDKDSKTFLNQLNDLGPLPMNVLEKWLEEEQPELAS